MTARLAFSCEAFRRGGSSGTASSQAPSGPPGAFALMSNSCFTKVNAEWFADRLLSHSARLHAAVRAACEISRSRGRPPSHACGVIFIVSVIWSALTIYASAKDSFGEDKGTENPGCRLS
eukprot:5348322-Alexandrium_andersonii.AAC.1